MLLYLSRNDRVETIPTRSVCILVKASQKYKELYQFSLKCIAWCIFRTGGHTMTEDFATHPAAVDSRTLAPLVAQALDRPEVELLSWGYETLGGGFGHLAGVSGLYRFS